jgi:hypothetical protein
LNEFGQRVLVKGTAKQRLSAQRRLYPFLGVMRLDRASIPSVLARSPVGPDVAQLSACDSLVAPWLDSPRWGELVKSLVPDRRIQSEIASLNDSGCSMLGQWPVSGNVTSRASVNVLANARPSFTGNTRSRSPHSSNTGS